MADGSAVVSAKTPLGILVNVCGITESSLVVVRRVLREFFRSLVSLRQAAFFVASVNSIGNGTELHRSVCALDALLQQIERIRPVTGKRENGLHARHECTCRRDLPNAMRLLQQAEYHIMYITAPTTAPHGDELKQFVRGSSAVVQFVLLRAEGEDIQGTADSVMALVDATVDMPAVTIVQSEDNVIEMRDVMKPLLRKMQSHVTSTLGWPSSAQEVASETSLQLVLRSSFSMHETHNATQRWQVLHGGLVHLSALHVVPLTSVDGSVVIGLPMLATSASNHPDSTAVNLHYFLQSNESGVVVKCNNKTSSAFEFYLLVPVGNHYTAQCPFMLYRLAASDQMVLPPASERTTSEQLPPDTSFVPPIPRKLFNPFDYDSGSGDAPSTPAACTTSIATAAPQPRPVKPKARRLL